MKKNHLIFGGSGFIGHHLVQAINKKSIGLPLIFDIVTSINKNDFFEEIDVKKAIETRYKPSKEDVIFNLAAIHRTPGHPSHEYFETNIVGAQNICDYARKHSINTIVFTSSIATYGTYEEPKHEETIPRPDIPYGISKLTAEYIHKLWQLEDPKSRKLIILRPGVVFGQYENGNFTRLINSISSKTFFFPGRKDTIKACIYVKDLVEMMLLILEKEKMGVSCYNMTYEPAPSINEICNTVSVMGRLTKPKIKLPSSVLLITARIIYFLLRKEGVHPDRVKKLMISNNIHGKKLNERYKPIYGLEKGIMDWMIETKFNENRKIY